MIGKTFILAILLLLFVQSCSGPINLPFRNTPTSGLIGEGSPETTPAELPAELTAELTDVSSPGRGDQGVNETPGIFAPLVVGAGNPSTPAPLDSNPTGEVFVPVLVGKGTPEASLPSEPQRSVSEQENQRRFYALQPGSPVGMVNFVHSDLGCNWMGVGGQVFSASGEPIPYLVVELGGFLNNRPVSALALTGSATQWGSGGFEFTLANAPIASEKSLWLQFYNLSGSAVSNQIVFSTQADCSKNVILVNLVETMESQWGWLFPLILR